MPELVKLKIGMSKSGAVYWHSALTAHAEHVATFSTEIGGDWSEMQAK
jgi:hypothetical protein